MSPTCPICGGLADPAFQAVSSKELVFLEGFMLGATVLRLQSVGAFPSVMGVLCEPHRTLAQAISKKILEADESVIPEFLKAQVKFVVGPNLKAV